MNSSTSPATSQAGSQKIGEDLIKLCLEHQQGAHSLEQWIYWNNSPSRHIPQKKLEELFPKACSILTMEDSRTRNSIDAILRSQLSWKDPVAWAPDDSLFLISMLKPSTFERLALLAAAISLRGVLAQIIDGATIRKLRQEIGVDILEFALLSSCAIHQSLIPEITTSEDIVMTLRQTASYLIEYAFSGRSHAIQVRIASKLPGCFAQQFFDTPSPLAQETEKLLMKLWQETSAWL